MEEKKEMNYLTEHGVATLKNLSGNLNTMFNTMFPIKLNIVGIGNLVFTSRDELYGFIYCLRKLSIAEEKAKK